MVPYQVFLYRVIDVGWIGFLLVAALLAIGVRVWASRSVLIRWRRIVGASVLGAVIGVSSVVLLHKNLFEPAASGTVQKNRRYVAGRYQATF